MKQKLKPFKPSTKRYRFPDGTVVEGNIKIVDKQTILLEWVPKSGVKQTVYLPIENAIDSNKII